MPPNSLIYRRACRIASRAVAGFGWRSAPRWTRLSLLIGPVIFAVYVLAIKPHAPAAQH